MKSIRLVCARTFALWRPGVPFIDTPGRPRWTGAIPFTGRYRCTMCGRAQ